MTKSDRKPTEDEMDERYVIEADPEEALRQFLSTRSSARARDRKTDDDNGEHKNGDGT